MQISTWRKQLYFNLFCTVHFANGHEMFFKLLTLKNILAKTCFLFLEEKKYWKKPFRPITIRMDSSGSSSSHFLTAAKLYVQCVRAFCILFYLPVFSTFYKFFQFFFTKFTNYEKLKSLKNEIEFLLFLSNHKLSKKFSLVVKLHLISFKIK